MSKERETKWKTRYQQVRKDEKKIDTNIFRVSCEEKKMGKILFASKDGVKIEEQLSLNKDKTNNNRQKSIY